ncbi:hypothetical protein GCM10022381_26100 [Leifsonia kafniensis]|uniref:Uncharacterized protein n=2 Tax=Leifsonia kafniensis TaxID=475957 RepID=A0ABP7KMB7_9MICO
MARAEMTADMEQVAKTAARAHEESERILAASIKDYSKILADAKQQQNSPENPLSGWEPDPIFSPIVPLPEPRWSVRMVHETTERFELVNAVPRSVAKEVRIEGDQDIRILDAGHWNDLSGEAVGPFRGSLAEKAYRMGAYFTVTWFDENNQPKEKSVNLAREVISAHIPF